MTTPADWLRPEVLALEPYRVADASGLVKLDAMENPYDFPADLRSDWAQRLHDVALNRYPDPDAEALKRQLRTAMGIPATAELLLGNGSDEILQMLMLGLARPGACLMTPEPGFAMFRLIARATGLEYVGVDLRADFSLDVNAMLAAMEKRRPALVIVAQPNNPTGNLFDRSALRQIVTSAPGLVVIDEAYYPFADEDCLEWLDGCDNLLLMRTVSKLGLAGLRLGLLAGPAPWIEALAPLRLPYNINALTQVSAAFALEHYDRFAEQARTIVGERERLIEALSGLSGVTVFPSQANFVTARMPAGCAGTLYEGLRSRGILVKNVDGSHPLVADCLRFTIGTPEENAALLKALRESLPG